MELKDLERLLNEAAMLSKLTEFVIVGSLSALGVLGQRSAPPRMLMSIDVDCYTLRDPERIFDLNHALGAGSDFEKAHGYYLDPVSPKLPTLPAGWEHRLVKIPLGNITAHFLDPNDAAISKYARGEPRDREWIRAGIAAGILSLAIIESRFRDTLFLDEPEQKAARQRLEEDRRWHTRKR